MPAESDEVIWIIDSHNVVCSVSASSTRVLGWMPHEMTGRCPEFFFVAEDLLALPISPRTPDLSARSITFSARVRRKDGAYAWMTVTAGAARLSQPNVAMTIWLKMRILFDRKHFRMGVFRPEIFNDVA